MRYVDGALEYAGAGKIKQTHLLLSTIRQNGIVFACWQIALFQDIRERRIQKVLIMKTVSEKNEM